MKKLATIAAFACALAAPSPALSETYFGFTIGVGGAPTPPRVVFASSPEMIVVPGTGVYSIAEYPYDVFRYGGYYYMSYGGYWYRSRGYRGPFTVVDVRRVPRPIFYVPADYWKRTEWGPTRVRTVDVKVDKEKGNRGKGKGKGRS